MVFDIHISNIQFVNDTSVVPPQNGALIIVGPNSSGKSHLLREVSTRLVNPPQPYDTKLIVDDISLERSGEVDELLSWFRAHVSEELTYPDPRGAYFKGSAGELAVAQITSLWQHNWPRLVNLGTFLIATQFADTRLGLISGTTLHNQLTDVPTHPLQFLYSDTDLEEKLSRWVRDAFGFDVSVNKYGNDLRLLIGKGPQNLPPPPPPKEILKQYAEMRSIETEGDGVRAFVGLLLQVMLSARPIVIIDEPEAFLHPPQARRLGKLLVEEAPVSSQLIVATHSEDFLQGVLEARNRPVRVVRMDKKSGTFSPRTVEPERIRETWSKPLMRYSNLLNGLFHAGVVLCEADGDCRFYQAYIDAHLGDASGTRDLLYTHVNGKARIPHAVDQLRDFHVKVAAIVDLDVLNDAQLLKRTLESSGGSWESIKEDFELMRTSVEEMGVTLQTVDAVRRGVNQSLQGLSGNHAIPDAAADSIKDLIKEKSAWHTLKRGGIASLQGAGAEAAPRILNELQTHGIFVVPVGELERWIPLSVSKSAWIVKVLEEDFYLQENVPLTEFLRSIANYFSEREPEAHN